MMPPSRGIAPPLSPVPAPRPTMGTSCSRADFDDGDDVLGGAREDDQVGTCLVHAAVVFVKAQIGRVASERLGTLASFRELRRVLR